MYKRQVKESSALQRQPDLKEKKINDLAGTINQLYIIPFKYVFVLMKAHFIIKHDIILL